MDRPVYILDHYERAEAHLTSPLAGEKLRDLLGIFARLVQELEAIFYDLMVERTLDAARGVWLDQYGAIVGLARNGLDDDLYRRLIRVRILANRSNGQVVRVLEVASLLLAEESGPAQVLYVGLHPAAYALQWRRSEPANALLRSLAVQILREITPAGVGLDEIGEWGPGAFGWEEDPTALGFGVGAWTLELVG